MNVGVLVLAFAVFAANGQQPRKKPPAKKPPAAAHSKPTPEQIRKFNKLQEKQKK